MLKRRVLLQQQVLEGTEFVGGKAVRKTPIVAQVKNAVLKWANA